MRRGLLSACVAVPLLSFPACAQTPVREGDLERLVIVSAAEARAWGPAEATMTTESLPDGRPVLRFHVDVDYATGEKAYPIGWPRTNAQFREAWQRDWSAYDFLRLRLRAETSRDKLPSVPLGMNLYTPDKPRAYTRRLTELRKGEWVTLEIPLSQIPRHNDVTGIQFFISESDYRDKDTLDVFIEDICLLRYAIPHLSEVAVRPSVAFADAGHVLVSFRALGIAEGQTVTARASLLADGAEALGVEQAASRGANEIALDLRRAQLGEGSFTVRLQLAGGEAQECGLRLVESPWQ